jgi:superfamily I DNA/RNA helicase
MPVVDVNSNASLLEFIAQIGTYRVETVQKLEEAKRDDAASKVTDECECLEFFAQESRTIDEIAHRIEALFTDNDTDDKVVLMMTAHKSKGLEADRVWILRPDLMPFPRAKQDHEIEVERRIKYVALTRAALERYSVMKEVGEK